MATGSGQRTGRSGGRGVRGAAWLAAGAALLVVACGQPSPEAQLAEAREDLERARQEVASAEARYEETVRRVEKAREARDEASEALEAARAQLTEAKAEVGRYATDDAIFRTVQSRLLEDEKLSDVAIPVRVEDGVVVLTGEVPKESLAERAAELAGEVAGVVEVRSRIRVRSGEPKRREQGSEGSGGGGEQGGSTSDGGDAEGGAAAAQEE